MHPVPKRRLLYTGLFEALLKRCLASAMAAGIVFIVVQSVFSIYVVGFTGLILAVCALIIFDNRPGVFLEDLRANQPQITFGKVRKAWTEVGPSSLDTPGDLSWHVELQDGSKFGLGQGDYRKIAEGDHVWISYYAASRLVTTVGKLEMPSTVNGEG